MSPTGFVACVRRSLRFATPFWAADGASDAGRSATPRARVTNPEVMIRCLMLVVMTRADLLPTKITITDDASASERYAASMLQSHLQIACPKRTFTVGPPKGSRPGSEIIVGPGAALHYGLPAETLTGLGNESYYLGYFAPPLVGSVVLTGGIGSTRSTIYAVYSMLTDVIGFNFFAHDETAPPMECLDRKSVV